LESFSLSTKAIIILANRGAVVNIFVGMLGYIFCVLLAHFMLFFDLTQKIDFFFGLLLF
jgi:hypothetical protein